MSTAGERGRRVVKEVTVAAPPERVWQALTDPEELMRWFPPVARVEPGQGGSITLSWGEGMEGTAPIRVWEPPHRFGWVEEHGGDPPVRIAVEFEVEAAAGGSAIVRLVQSGFGPEANWDDYINSVDGGWTYFLTNLRHYLERHRDVPRTMISDRSPPRRSHEEAWDTLLGEVLRVRPADGPDASGGGATAGGSGTSAGRPDAGGRGAAADTSLERDGGAPGTAGGIGEGQAMRMTLPDLQGITGTAFLVRRPTHFGCTLAELNDALLLVELEPGGENWHCGVWLSLYGVDGERAARVRTALTAAVAQAWAPPGQKP